MTPPRAIQNFRGFRGVWAGPRGHQEQALRGALARLGVAAAHADELGADGLCAERDVLFIDGDAPFDPALPGAPDRMVPVVPVIGVVGVEAPSRLKALREAGATAFLHKPIRPATVYPALFLAANNHARFARLEAAIAEHNRRRGGRRHVVGAVIRIMRHAGLCDEQAYAYLRRESMRRRVAIEEFARAVCETDALLTAPPSPPEQEDIDAVPSHEAAGDDRARSASHPRAATRPGRGPDQARRARRPVG